MDNHLDNYFFHYNKTLDENLDELSHNVERHIDKLYKKKTDLHYYGTFDATTGPRNRAPNPYSTVTYSHFGTPYIRDFRNFSAPLNDDVTQIQELTGNENIDHVIKNKAWTKESREKLQEAVLEFYATSHTVRLIKQEEILLKEAKEKQATTLDTTDCKQNLKLIEEQKEQVKSRKDPRIFVPEDRLDPNVDWCQISAKLDKTLHDAQDCRLLWQNELHRTINNNLWSKEEDDCLLKAVEKYGKNDWDSISKELNSNRLPWQCCARFQQEFAKAGQALISQEDTNKILDVINLCKIGNYVPWNQVMYFIKFYGLHQVKYQWNKLMSERASGQPWSNNEDNNLLGAIEKYGVKNWNRIASCVSGRSNRSCRERYVMRLKFDRRAIGKWNAREDLKLLACVDKLGTNWAPVSNHFANRNEHQIRNRYEILKNNRAASIRRGAIKHCKLVIKDGEISVQMKRRFKKPSSEIEVDQRLLEIFSSYHNIKSSKKSIVCRSGLDESIYQNLIKIIKAFLTNRQPKIDTLLAKIIVRALETEVFHECDILTPNNSTLQGYKAWFVMQDYLSQFTGENTNNLVDSFVSSDKYERLRGIVISLFLWPAVLSKLRPREFDTKDFIVKSIIDKGAENLYKVRDIQKNLGTTLDQTPNDASL